MFRNYVNSMLMGRPHQPLFNADPGGGGGTPNDPPPSDPPPNDPPPNDPEDPPNDDPVKFDERQQSEIQKIIDRTIAKERKRADDEKKKAEERAKLSAEEKAEAERKDREEAAAEKERKANERIVNLEIKDVARELGVSAKKLDRFLKVIDKEELTVDENGDVDRGAVEAAVKAVLADMPEFKGTGGSAGPGTEFNQGGGTGAKYTMAQIQSMSPEETKANWEDIMKSMEIHNKK